MTGRGSVGSLVGIWRYPVKSMMGEELNAADITGLGLFGDRAYALLDKGEGKVGTAKNPRKWPNLFSYRSSFVEEPAVGQQLPPVKVTLPDGVIARSDQAGVDGILSQALKRDVALVSTEGGTAAAKLSQRTSEEYWPDMEGLENRDVVTDFDLPEGTFFDIAVLHLLTTSTIDRLRELYPAGRFEVRRFRPNLVLETGNTQRDFAENAWVGRTLTIGAEVRLHISEPTGRCVMTTLAQGDLPGDTGILRAAVEHNNAQVGVYASVESGGRIRRGDVVSLE